MEAFGAVDAPCEATGVDRLLAEPSVPVEAVTFGGPETAASGRLFGPPNVAEPGVRPPIVAASAGVESSAGEGLAAAPSSTPGGAGGGPMLGAAELLSSVVGTNRLQLML